MERIEPSSCDYNTATQAITLAVVCGLLLLTALGSAEVMFWLSLIATFLLFVWFLAERKIWLASIAGITFIATVLLTAKSLF